MIKLRVRLEQLRSFQRTQKNTDMESLKNHGWFTAYYPSDNPEIAITVFAEHGDSGGSAGGPIIKQPSYYKKNYLKTIYQL